MHLCCVVLRVFAPEGTRHQGYLKNCCHFISFVCALFSFVLSEHLPPVDNIRAVMIVWRTRRKITKTVLRCIEVGPDYKHLGFFVRFTVCIMSQAGKDDWIVDMSLSGVQQHWAAADGVDRLISGDNMSNSDVLVLNMDSVLARVVIRPLCC